MKYFVTVRLRLTGSGSPGNQRLHNFLSAIICSHNPTFPSWCCSASSIFSFPLCSTFHDGSLTLMTSAAI